MDEKLKHYLSEVNELLFSFDNCQELILITCSIFDHIETDYFYDMKLLHKINLIKISEYKSFTDEYHKQNNANLHLLESLFSSLKSALNTDISTHNF